MGSSVSAGMLIAARFVAAIGIGAELALVDAYLSEFLSPSRRGRYTAGRLKLSRINDSATSSGTLNTLHSCSEFGAASF